jgi:DNA-binding protein H-NS
VQQTISSNLSAIDDSSCHDTALRRSREHRIRAKITEVQNDICTWLNAAAARKIKLEQLPVTDDQVCDSLSLGVRGF